MRGHTPSTRVWCGGIHRLVEEHVEKRPDALAVLSATERITYRELGRRVRALSFLLGEKGVGANDRIALFANRSAEMVIGLLGILDAGAAYVPLDPAYPEERLSFMVSDCDAALVVVPAADRKHLPSGAAARAGVVEVPEDGIAVDTARARGRDVPPGGLAYVIYTSGSTGRPKGVLLEHGGLVNLMAFTIDQMELGPNDRVLQFASFSFDASIWEIFAALAAGGTLVLGDRDSLLPGPSLHDLMRELEVTVALLSPSVLRVLSPDGLDRLRIMVAGTEKLTSDLVRRWAPGRRFFNAYGPTETTIYSTILEVEAITDGAPTIGRPIPGTEVMILDEALNVLPDGEVGELAIAGVGVGRGYWRRDALTAERFLTRGERRIYRTGDHARILPDGNVEYLGRRDFQVKVRGFRVELPEIETTLERHPTVGSAAVLDDRDAIGQTLLRAFVVPRAGSAVDPSELRRFLAGRLPDYMVPSSVNALARWPLTPNGKLDREALLRDSTYHPERETETDTRPTVLGLVRDVLGVDDLAPDDSLGDTGLHSLAVAELVARIESVFGVRVKYSEVFLDGSARALAARVAKAVANRPETSVVRHGAPSGEAIEETVIPLSFAQEGIWLVERLHPGCRAYRFLSRFDIEGPLDVEALTKSLNAIVSRHEILRTTFPERDGRPVQRIHAFEPFSIPVEDPPASLDELALEPDGFDVSRLPLIRWRLFRLAPERHLLLHLEHHLLHDGWSFGVFLAELAELYRSFHVGKEAVLPPPSLQYRDFARRQRKRPPGQAALDYWIEALDALPPPHTLPADFPRPETKRFRGAQLRATIDAPFYRTLREAAVRENVTIYTWLHAVFQTFLHRFTGASDLAVGTGFANRGEAGLDRMLGMVIHTAVIRGDLSGRPTFRELLRRLRRTILDAADHQDVPFDAVVRALNPDRPKVTESLLFSTFFDSYDKPFPELAWPELEVERVDGISNGSSKFDLVALVVPRTRHARGVESATLIWDYDTDLFRPETAERMMAAYLGLLRASLARPDERIDRLSLGAMAASSRDVILLEASKRTRGPRPASVVDAFAARCAERPEAAAIESNGVSISYRELDERASRLAHVLIRIGVERGDVVGVRLPRGIDAVTAMLAVLEAGAGYLPLDPGLPPRRLAALLGSVPPVAIVSHEPVPGYDGRIVPPHAAGSDPARPHVALTAEDLAYVMYTSGTTGAPKGVDVPHRGILRLVLAPGYVEMTPDDRVLQLAPLSFDASTFEIWGSLLNGATLVIHPEPVPSAVELAAFASSEAITTAWLTAPLFHLAADTGFRVKTLLAGGDVLSVPKVRAYLDRLEPGEHFVNGYGPTENTTFSCCHVMTSESALGRTVPIGTPIADSTAYVLDDTMELVGPAVPGELFVGGDGLAWGYRSRPAETAAAFVPDPFSTSPGSRLYRTGDFCRRIPDGSIEFIGRRDLQVKLRGFRVELAEVEALLGAMPGVSQAAAKVEDDTLVAFVASDGVTDEAAVRSWAAERLPSHMVPSIVVMVEAIPLTASGKIDRARLPALAAVGRRRDGPSHVAPRSDRERAIAALWCELLSIDAGTLGVHDNFFAIGGHSLLASRIATRLGVPLATLFRFPTVAELASALDAFAPREAGVLESTAREEGEI